MGIGQQLGGMPNEKMTYQELIDHVANLQKTIEYYLGGNIDSDNAREFGGWQIKKDVLQAKDLDVGLSTANDGVDPIRVWAGDTDKNAAPFQVHQSGKVVANDLQMTGGDIIWGDVTPPSYSEIFGPKPPADANNTYNELLFNTGIRGFVNVGGTLYISADFIRAGTITSVNINAFDPATPNKRLEIKMLDQSTGGPIMNFWSDTSTTIAKGSAYIARGNFNGDGIHDYFSLWGTDRMQITSGYVWFNAGTVDFSGATIKGLNNTTAVFG